MSQKKIRIFTLLFLLFAFALPILAQEEASAELDVTLVVIGAFITVGVMALGVVWAAVASGKSVSEAAKAGGESAVRGIISNKAIASWGEEGLSHIPEPIRKAMLAVTDAFNPATAKTISDLDNKTQEWMRNLLDGNAETGAVSFDPDDNPF